MLVNNQGVNKLRRCKRKLERLNRIVTSYIDSDSENYIDSETLKQMLLISQIDELITEVIYYIIEKQ